MPVLNSRHPLRFTNRHGLLVGASAVALLLGSVVGADARGLNGGSGGNTSASAAAIAAAAAQAGAQQGSATAQQAIASMARAAQSLEGMRSAQNAARAAALAGGSAVPNGLQPGGLVMAPGAGTVAGVWTGADLPNPTVSGGRTQVEIRQTEQKAILNWSSFNVGRETDVYFNQTAGGADKAEWIALNRVTDPSLAPSRILGTIRADGQVYVINKNGIVFGGASQVNVNTFVASSLSLSDEQFRAGINKQLLVFNDDSGASIAAPQFGYLGQQKPNQFVGVNDPFQTVGAVIGAAPGDVTIEAGAQLTMASGGKALVFAPRVFNNGKVSAPDGQVIMAAGEQVYLIDDKFNGIRGLDIAVSAPMRWMFDYYNMATATKQGVFANENAFVLDLRNIVFPEMAARAASVGYAVVNNGLVQADHGNITLMSRSITQNGALEAATALNNRDGSIILRAWEGGMRSYGSSMPDGSPMRYWATGTLTLGSGSVTTAMPDLTDISEIEQTSLQTRYSPGRIEMRGKLIDIEARANVIVPADKISIVASTLADVGETPISGERNVYDGSRVYIGEDAFLSVAGLQDVLLTMESNTVTGEFRINELRDSPLYRDSWLRGKTVSVDKRVAGLFTDGPMSDVQWITGSPGAWVGTPLGDFSGWIGVGKTTLGELSTKAGSIAIKSGGEIITRAGSLLDVSGGSVRYQDGWITTSKLLGADGRIYDIGKAMPDQLYVGFAGTFARTHNVQGRLDTRLTENWTTIFDRNTARRFERGYIEGRDAGTIRMFAASAIVLDGGYWGGIVNGERQLASGKRANAGAITIGGLSDEHGRWIIGDLIISGNAPVLPVSFGAGTALGSEWGVPPMLKPDTEDPNHPGTMIPPDPNNPNNWIEPVKKTYLDSDVLAQSGMGTFNFFVRNSFTLGEGERLELAPAASFNVTVNSNQRSTFTIDGSIRIAGGTVRLAAAKSGHYGATASIDVSGDWRNGPLGGEAPVIKGGTIVVSGEFAPGATFDVSGGGWYDTSGSKSKLTFGDAGSLSLTPTDIAQLADLDLRGYSAASGGTLAIISTGSIRIGGAVPVDSTVGWLPGTLFADRGFRSFALATTGDIVVADGTTVTQIPVSFDVASINPAAIPSGARFADVAGLTTRPLVERIANKPTSLSLTGDNIVIGAGAVVKTDARGSIDLVAIGHPDETNTNVPGSLTVNGTIEALAGTISLASNDELKLGAGAQIIAKGAAVVAQDVRGLRYGEVLAGGTVALSNALIMKLDAGSIVDVSGASGEFDLDGGRGAAHPYSMTSDGGTISLGFSGLANDVIAGNFLAHGGGAGSIGGTLAVRVGTKSEQTPAFDLPATIYYRDRVTDQIKALNPRASLDIYSEYSSTIDAAFRYNTVRSAIIAASTELSRGGGLAIIDGSMDTTPAGVAQPLSSVMTSSVRQLDLLTKYFYSDIDATQRIQLPSATIKLTKISADSFKNGGFGTLDVNTTAFMVAPGINLALGKSISITGAISSGGAGTAAITAPYIVLNGGSGTPGAAGVGKMVMTAGLIDVTRAAFGGFAETQLIADELRMGGLLRDLTANRSASLSADGRFELKVGQIYPATGIMADVEAGVELVISPNGERGLPLSAAGTLNLKAPVITQNGIVRAPFGSITLTATDSITLGAGSITSVSGDGLIIPYGMLSNNEFWIDPTIKVLDGKPTPSLSKLPEKNIVLQGLNVNLAAGSVVDIRGGGDLYAWEHVPGPGGSHDILAQPGVYAIMPGQTVSGGSQQKIWLAGGNGLAAGWYELLPARYALLPGAFAVSMVKGSTDARQWGSSVRPDGTLVTTGYLADAYGGGYEQLQSSWRVMSGATLRSYSEYNEAFANTYFASDAFKLGQYRLNGINVVTPRLSMDGGSVVFKATSSLVLDGTLQSQPAAGGRGGLVDIAGSKIAIVGAGQDRSDLAGYLVIDAGSLSNFGAGSLLVGGVRGVDARGMRVDVSATNVLVRNDASSILSGSEILLAASGAIDVKDGSVIVATGSSPGAGVDLVMTPQVKAIYGDIGTPDTNPDNDVLLTPAKDYGALIRVSTGNAVNVIRQNVDTTTGGVVTVGAGAIIAASNALMLDATRDTNVAGSANLSGAAMSLASGRIGFGGGTSGLILDTASLAQFVNTDALTLRSYSSIDFYSSVDFGNAGRGTVTLDAAAFVGHGNETVVISGRSIALDNSSAVFAGPAGAGHARLHLRGDEIVLGSGSKTLTGFETVVLEGSQQIVGRGNGKIDAQQADVTLASPLLTGRGAASQALVTQGALRVSGEAGSAGGEDSLGTRISLTGASIDLSGRIVARGGAVNLTTTGGNLVVGAGSTIDVSGFRKDFFDVTEYADAGSIALTAVGSVVLSPGGALNLAADQAGGNAGKLTLIASGGGTVVLGGHIDATAGAGGKGGSFTLDIAELPNYAAFSQVLNAAGFSASRNMRIRSGNVVIDGVTTVGEFVLSADRGSVTLAGLIDARSAYGGNIAISAGNGLTMLSSAVLQACATGEFGSGRVTLDARGGRMDVAGGTIDVSGAEGGRVRFRARQTIDNDEIDVDRLQVTVLGARSAVLEGVDVVESGTGSVDAVRADAIAHARTFAGSATAIAARLNAAGIDVMPGIEIQSSGDLAPETDWNLAVDFPAIRLGSLTLRAGGNLSILGNLSDGFSQTGALMDADSWNLRLVAGADLSSADVLSLTPMAALAAGSGQLTIGTSGNGRFVRTGTGDLDVRAGRDLALAHYQSAIYTAGRVDTASIGNFVSPDDAVYAIGGGNLRIGVQGSASAALAPAGDASTRDENQLFVEWLKKSGTTDGSFVYLDKQQASWWIDYSQFAQGVGALGGGNVSFSTGGDLSNMLVAVPTTGRVSGGGIGAASGPKVLHLRNGGLMDVNAGGAVRAGYYYVGRGEGEIVAGEFAIGRTVSATSASGRVTNYEIAPVIALGDSVIRVRTAGDLRLQTVLDPLLLNGDSTWFPNSSGGLHAAIMSGYTDRTSLDLTSTGGNITLVQQGRFLSKALTVSESVTDGDYDYSMIGQIATNLYPSVTRIAALNGSVDSLGRLFTMPGSRPELRILADGNVTLNETIMSRANPDMLASPYRPTGYGSADIRYSQGTMKGVGRDIQRPDDSGFHEALRNKMNMLLEQTYGYLGSWITSVRNPDRLINADDDEPSRIFSRNGSIVNSLYTDNGQSRWSALVSNEQTWIRAGTDIRNIDYNLRNTNRTDVSMLDAGKDIIGGKIVINGPGAALLTAGRDVYGSNFSVTSFGGYDLYGGDNRATEFSRIRGLPSDGAAITVMAGLQGQQLSYDAFAAAYLDPANMASMPDYLKVTTTRGEYVPIYFADMLQVTGGKATLLRGGLARFVYDMTGETLDTAAAVWARFQALPALTQQRFLREVYMQELRASGDNQLTLDADDRPLNGGYKRGYTAIASLFPGNAWKGDIKLGSGTFRTMAGGNIETLTPGGGLQVAALGATVLAGEGLVTLGYGDINIFARDNVTVNRSRILTFAGGDVTIWSTLGDIDAGRGAKTARVPSAPEITTDEDGNTKVQERADIGGSGIGTIIGFTGVEPGDVSLIAPEGTVDAGDAGIRVSGNFVVAALQVLNAENIKVDGDKKGMPKVEALSDIKMPDTKDKAAADAVKDATQSNGNERPSVIIVEVLGYGGAGAADQGTEKQSEEELKKRRDQRSDNYDPTSPVQVLGVGQLTDLQTEALIYEKKRFVR